MRVFTKRGQAMTAGEPDIKLRVTRNHGRWFRRPGRSRRYRAGRSTRRSADRMSVEYPRQYRLRRTLFAATRRIGSGRTIAD